MHIQAKRESCLAQGVPEHLDPRTFRISMLLIESKAVEHITREIRTLATMRQSFPDAAQCDFAVPMEHVPHRSPATRTIASFPPVAMAAVQSASCHFHEVVMCWFHFFYIHLMVSPSASTHPNP